MSDPLTRLVELTVYAPIGLAAVARERLPEYVEEGRVRVEQRLTLARFIGQMVVTQGRREVERRLAESGPATGSSTRSASPTTGATTASQPSRASRPVPNEPAPTDATVPPAGEDVPTAASLPIDDYESLAAAQVVARLADLDAGALAQIEAFERTHRNRRTVLNRIGQLQGPA